MNHPWQEKFDPYKTAGNFLEFKKRKHFKRTKKLMVKNMQKHIPPESRDRVVWYYKNPRKEFFTVSGHVAWKYKRLPND